MGRLVREIEPSLASRDLERLGHLLSIHQLIQEKIGSSTPESEALIDAAMGAGALGAKISGAGGGGIIIALATPGAESRIAQAIAKAGGEACVVSTNAAGVRVVAEDEWLEARDPRSTWVSEADK
jgi:mevalonate kinase